MTLADVKEHKLPVCKASEFRLGACNVNGWNSGHAGVAGRKFARFLAMLHDKKHDISINCCAISELHLRHLDRQLFSQLCARAGMQWVSTGSARRDDRPSTGTGLLVHKSLRFERPTELLPRVSRDVARHITWISLVQANGRRLHVASVYLPTHGHANDEHRARVLEAIKDDAAVFNELRDDWIILGDFNARVGSEPTYAILEQETDTDSDVEYADVEDGKRIRHRVERASIDKDEPNARGKQLLNACERMRAVLLNGAQELPGSAQADWTYVSQRTKENQKPARSILDYALCSSALYMRERRHIDFRTHGENAADGGVWMTDLFIDHAILALRIPSVQVQHGQLSPETKAKERAAKTVHPSAAKRRTVQSIDLAQWGATCKDYLPPIQALVVQALDGLHLPPAQSVESEGSTSMPPLAVDLEALFSTFTTTVDAAIEQTPKLERAAHRDNLNRWNARDAVMQQLKCVRRRCERQFNELRKAKAPEAELGAARERLRMAAKAARKRSLIVYRQQRRAKVQHVEQLWTDKRNMREFWQQLRRLDFNECSLAQHVQRHIPNTVLGTDGTERSGTEAVHAAYRDAWASISAYDPSSPAFDQAFHDKLRESLAQYSTQAQTPGHDEAATSTDKHSGLLADLNAPIETDELHEAIRRLHNNTRGVHGE